MTRRKSSPATQPAPGKRPFRSLRRVAIDTTARTWPICTASAQSIAPGFPGALQVEVRANGQRVLATLNVWTMRRSSAAAVGLSEDAFALLALPDGHPARISQAQPAYPSPPASQDGGRERLGREDFVAVMRDIAELRYSKIRLTTIRGGLQPGRAGSRGGVLPHRCDGLGGQRLDWHEQPVVDKHCIGGIPGNRTSMLVVPIVAAHGMLCPKTSSRAITSPAGTADTMEVLANVGCRCSISPRWCAATAVALAWGGTAALSPADDVLISVERPLSIDSPGQMVASILLPRKSPPAPPTWCSTSRWAPPPKVRSMPRRSGCKLFQFVASQCNLTIDVVITDGRQPIGSGIGRCSKRAT